MRDGEHAARLAMPLGHRVFDQEHESPGNRGNVIDLWGLEDDWSFRTDGALALQPEPAEPGGGGSTTPVPALQGRRRFRLPPQGTSLKLPRMATTEAAGFAARARRRQREAARTKARRARRTAALVVVASGCLVALLLTAFGTGDRQAMTITGPAPAERLLPAGPPRPQIVAMQDSLRLQLPVNQSRVTVIGYHAAGTDALPLDPVGTQANAGLVERLFRKLFGSGGSDTTGQVGPATATTVTAPEAVGWSQAATAIASSRRIMAFIATGTPVARSGFPRRPSASSR